MKNNNNFLLKIFFLLGDDKKKLPKMGFLFILLSVFDLAGLGLIAPFISLILSSDNSTFYLFLDFFNQMGMNLNKYDLIKMTGFSIIFIFLIKVLFGILINIMILKFSWSQQTKIRFRLIKRFQSMNYSEYLNRNSSDYIQIIHSMVGQYIMNAVIPFLKIISESIVVVSVFILLAYNNFNALLLLVSIVSIIMLLYYFIFRDKLIKHGEDINVGSTSMLKAISEGMEGFKEIRILSKETIFSNLVLDGATKNAEGQVKSQSIIAAPRYILEFLIIVFIVGLVLINLSLNSSITELAPTLGLFGVAAVRLLPSINVLFSSFNSIKSGTYAVSKVYNDLTNESVEKKKEKFSSSKNIKNKFEKIELKNISFSYLNSNDLVLKNISLSITNGESIGIMGSSGSGKTTLIDIILGLLKIDSGEILLNNRNLYNHLSEWKSQVAYLPQKVFVIDDSLKQNISLLKKDEKINLKKLNESIKKARLNDLIDQLENGIETKVGERGSRISGGQSQRVSLARAFYHERNVLILDEATSSLDYETELKIVDEIKFLKGKTTLIVIAHRLSTLKHCDKIYKIENGLIVGSGSYNEMIK